MEARQLLPEIFAGVAVKGGIRVRVGGGGGEVPEGIGQGYAGGIHLIVVIKAAGLVMGELLASVTFSQFTGDS